MRGFVATICWKKRSMVPSCASPMVLQHLSSSSPPTCSSSKHGSCCLGSYSDLFAFSPGHFFLFIDTINRPMLVYRSILNFRVAPLLSRPRPRPPLHLHLHRLPSFRLMFDIFGLMRCSKSLAFIQDRFARATNISRLFFYFIVRRRWCSCKR